MSKDFYEELGVEKTASADDIKKAYRKLTMKYHPDRNPGNKDAEERFKRVTKAYDTLSDNNKRAQYDQFGESGPQFGGGGAGNPFGGGGFNNADLHDIFSDLFGGGGGRHQQRNPNGPVDGNDLQYRIEITLETAAFGEEKQITIPAHEMCQVCKGTGCASGTSRITCPRCHGAGAVNVSSGFFQMQQECPTCHGVGQVIKNPCKTCHGQGRKEIKKTIKVSIPPGVDTGSKLRVQGEGEPGLRGGAKGDLYIVMQMREHDVFERHESDLLAVVPVSNITAMLGGTVEVPTVFGKTKVRIEAGTQSGMLLRLRGKGLPMLRGGGRGDQLYKIVVETPINLTAEERGLLEQLERMLESKTLDKHFPQSAKFVKTAERFLK